MPPRHTYWTIIFGNQPTAFRSATREELLPTFRQIQAKHPDAVMMWFARGRLWRSEEDARDALNRRREPPRGPKPEWKRDRGPRPEWRDRPPRDREEKPQWRDRPPRERDNRPQWRDRPPRERDERPQWRDRPRDGTREHAFRGPKPAWKDRPRGPQGDRPFNPKDRWRDRPPGDRPQGNRPPGGEGARGRDWRPGGDHKDPRDRFKVPRDVKRARFKAKLRRDRFKPPDAGTKPPGGEDRGKPGSPKRRRRDGGRDDEE